MKLLATIASLTKILVPRNQYTLVVILILALSFSTASLLIEVNVNDQIELDRLPLGWPIAYLNQNLSRYTPMTWPQKFSLVLNGPISINLVYWLLNLGLYFVAFRTLHLFTRGIFRRIKYGFWF
jgi:hypothetical protein